jgi:SPX domain protein involved in polyphosphate accumulation
MVGALKNSKFENEQIFDRYEFKFILLRRVRERIEKEISGFMRYDGHASGDGEKSYFVRSLYFDTKDNENFYDKIDGVKNRKKFRLRTYSPVFGASPIYLELKNRKINRVSKKRVRIDNVDNVCFSRELDVDYIKRRYSSSDVVDSFCFAVLSAGISPKVVIDYVRAPYVSEYDMNFRVTLDSELRCSGAKTLFDIGSPSVAALSGYSIMEVKFNRRIPAWFHKIIQAYNLERVSVSKFVLGMRGSRLAVDRS